MTRSDLFVIFVTIREIRSKGGEDGQRDCVEDGEGE